MSKISILLQNSHNVSALNATIENEDEKQDDEDEMQDEEEETGPEKTLYSDDEKVSICLFKSGLILSFCKLT